MVLSDLGKLHQGAKELQRVGSLNLEVDWSRGKTPRAAYEGNKKLFIEREGQTAPLFAVSSVTTCPDLPNAGSTLH